MALQWRNYTQKKGEGQSPGSRSRWSIVHSLPTFPLALGSRFLVAQQLLRGEFYLLEQPSLVAGLVDGGLQFVAELGQTFQPLLIREIPIQRIFQGHLVSESAMRCSRNQYSKKAANAIPETLERIPDRSIRLGDLR